LARQLDVSKKTVTFVMAMVLSGPESGAATDEMGLSAAADHPPEGTNNVDTSVKEDHRLVILVGPHKSASSSIQDFFFQYASSRDEERRAVPALQNWTWPFNRKRQYYRGPKAFAALVKESSNRQLFVPHIYQSIRDALLQQSKSRESFQLILGTEEFDRFGPTPWSHWDGIKAIRDVVDVVATEIHNLTLSNQQVDTHRLRIEFVVNYRRPRSDHWISIWKQLTRKLKEEGNPNHEYRSFLCSNDNKSMLWEYLDAVANPLGLSKTLLEEFVLGKPKSLNESGLELVISMDRVHVMDMQGIAKDGLDVSHSVSCEVLNVRPCPEGWLEIVVPEGTHTSSSRTHMTKNQRSGDPRLSVQQLEYMEMLFRNRDCSYRSSLQSAEAQKRLLLHHGHELWDDCVSMPESHNARTWNATSTDDLLDLLRDQVGCGPVTQGMNRVQAVELQSKTNVPFLSDELAALSNERQVEQIVKIQIASMLLLGVGLLTWISPRSYGWTYSRRVRAAGGIVR
jgi:hypothetical protein